jgi:hypothetical protein
MGNALQIQETAPRALDYRSIKPKQRLFLKKLTEAGFVIRKAAELTGISEVTAFAWIRDPRFRPYWDDTIERAVPIVEAHHLESAMGKDTLSRLHFLRHRHPAYREKPLEIVQRTDANTVLTATANAIAATELSKAISLLIGATKQPSSAIEVETETVPSLPETLSIPTP